MRRALLTLVLALPCVAQQGSLVDYLSQVKNRPNVMGDNNRAYPNLAAACADAITYKATLSISKIWRSAQTQSCAANVQFDGGIIQPASGQTVTFTGSMTAGLVQAFDLSLGGTVVPGATPVYYPQWWGAKCDGATNDAAAFQQAINTAASGGTIGVPRAGGGCLLSTGITVTKAVALTAGAPSVSPGQILSGANGITLISVTGAGSRSKFENLQLDSNGHTGVTGVRLSDATNVSFDGAIWNGAFANAVVSVNSYFTSYRDTRVFGALTGFDLGSQSNSTALINAGFYLGTYSGAVIFHNSQGLSITGGTFECGSQLTMYNASGVAVHGVYFESVPASCGGAMSQFISVGAPFGAAPMYGVDISGNLFNGGADYSVQIGPVQGLTFESNYCRSDVACLSYDTQGAFANSRDIRIGANSYNVAGAGYDETKILSYLNGYPNTLASNTTAMQFSPMLFSASMPVPQDTHVPSSDASVYWAGGYLKMKWKDSGGTVTNTFRILDGDCVPSSSSAKCAVDGTLQVRPYGLANTAAALMVFDNLHRLYLGQENSAGSSFVNSDAYAAIIATNDALPIDLCTAGNCKVKVLTGGGGLQILAVTVAGLPACNDALEGAHKPVTDANSVVFNAVIVGGGANHVEAYCAGSAAGWRVH